ncbi:DUF6522 family protein [Elioraea sp.]|jgi:hypothetical protein|uniref:DUF6522 family protein n=1 Tax=Elioraea sp. TaxID=2185103 RepID=UPI0021DC61B8|nr:DUF6522 family protein [Elioraea sp.]GIX08665.1 MAG: hypothetical protein KatS3mg116_0375 [Elioraea sp.]
MIGTRVAIEAGAPVLTPAQMAAALGLDERALRDELRAGRVFSLVERGEGRDAGRLRGRLRWRSLEVVLVIGADGTVLEMTRTGEWRR